MRIDHPRTILVGIVIFLASVVNVIMLDGAAFWTFIGGCLLTAAVFLAFVLDEMEKE